MSFWSDQRRSKSTSRSADDHRIAHQHDYDRLLFSTPVRRLADKTQVFPLDRNDGVRTRLTHSHEVANLARSMGHRLFKRGRSFDQSHDPEAILAILSTVGLAHDLGNPPFGHQGEASISHWFREHQEVFDAAAGDVPEHLLPEFKDFEGNAQSVRVVTQLQVSAGHVGLDLTAGTLAALMKYTVSCDMRDKSNAAAKKYGYFESEHEIVAWIRAKTGLPAGRRHPLTWIMEAADDIAYSILDVEDAIKKGIISPDDMLSIISESGADNREVYSSIKGDFKKIDRAQRSIGEVREIKSAYVRTNLIRILIAHAVEQYEANFRKIMGLEHTTPLLEDCGLCALLKRVALTYAFSSKEVRKVEADGAVAISGLMDFFWRAIEAREKEDQVDSRRTSASAAYGWSLLSDNYRQIAKRAPYKGRDGQPLPMRYTELRLLTDMIAGMTDGFAQMLYLELKAAGHISA